MVGREVDDLYPKKPADDRRRRCSRCSGLTRAGVFNDVSFDVRAGEIVGLAGLVGAGRSESPGPSSASTATTPARSTCWASRVPPHNPRAAIGPGMALVPEDRRKQGLVMDMSIERNIAGVIRAASTARRPDRPRRREQAAGPWAVKLEVKSTRWT